MKNEERFSSIEQCAKVGGTGEDGTRQVRTGQDRLIYTTLSGLTEGQDVQTVEHPAEAFRCIVGRRRRAMV